MPAALLVLTDFFQAANQALDYATNLAAPLGARLVLLHVRHDSIIEPEMFTGQLSDLSQAALSVALNSVSHRLIVPVVAEVGHGRVAFAVADAVSRHYPALVVLGRPDYAETPDALVHTTCLDLLRLTSCPLLVVPYTLANRTLPRRVLLAVDGEPFSPRTHAGIVHHLLAALHAEVTVLHVLPLTDSEDAAPKALGSVLQTGLLAGLSPIHTCTMVHFSPSRGIVQMAQTPDFDLVMVVARQRSFLSMLFNRGITAQVLMHSPLPVLVLPAQ